MKRYRVPLLGLMILALIATVLIVPIGATYIPGLGTTYATTSDNLSAGLHYTEYRTEKDGDAQHGYLFTYTPNASTAVKVASNLSVWGRSTLYNTIQTEQMKGVDVVAGINGDFFSMQTGVPMGVYISEGRLFSSCDDRPALGIRADGSALIGYPDIRLTLSTATETIPISHFNKAPTQYGSYLLDAGFFTSTKSSSSSTEIVIRILEGKVTPSGSLSGIVQAVNTNTSDTDITEDCLVLSVNNRSSQFSDFSKLKLGELVQINISCTPGWEDIVTAFGGGDILLENNMMPNGIVDEDHESLSNPRTAAGITAEGRLLFFAVDGRRSDGVGLTMTDLATTMKSLGCVSALNLDGGGSTTVVLKSGTDGSMITANSPSDGYQRKISTSILFVNTEAVTNIPSTMTMSPASSFMLRGSTRPFTLTVRDTGYNVMQGVLQPGNISYAMSQPGVGMMQNGIFTASAAGTTTVTANAYVAGYPLSATTTVTVVDRLDNFTVTPEAERLPSGERLNLHLMGYLGQTPVYADASAFFFSFGDQTAPNTAPNAIASCNAGYIGRDGYFYAYEGSDGETVTFTVSYVAPGGGPIKSETVSIRVGIEPEIIDGFEDNDTTLGIFAPDVMSTVDYVPGGFRSEKALSLSGYSVIYDTPKVVEAELDRFELWIKGDLFGKAYICVTDCNGIQYDLHYYIAEDYNRIGGWTRLCADLPEEAVSPISIDSLFVSMGAVDILLDELTANYGDVPEIFADIEYSWAKDEILTLYNMGLADGTMDAAGQLYYYPDNILTRAEYAKLLTTLLELDTSPYDPTFVTSDMYASMTGIRFADEAGIPAWALPYIRAVAAEGYMRGTADANGQVSFRAGEFITRLEVMYSVGNVLEEWELKKLQDDYNDRHTPTVFPNLPGITPLPEDPTAPPSFIVGDTAPDTEPEQEEYPTVLPPLDDSILAAFADGQTVPDWAKEQVKRTVHHGIFTAAAAGNLNVQTPVTRAEIAVVFTRLVRS